MVSGYENDWRDNNDILFFSSSHTQGLQWEFLSAISFQFLNFFSHIIKNDLFIITVLKPKKDLLLFVWVFAFAINQIKTVSDEFKLTLFQSKRLILQKKSKSCFKILISSKE